MPSGEVFTFGRFRLEVDNRRLFRDSTQIQLPSRQFDLLLALLQRAGTLVTKDELIAFVWKGTAVEDNTLARVVMQLRALLDEEGHASHVETVERHGYRWVTPIARTTATGPVTDLEALLAPHRIWVDGRAALETLALSEIQRARRELAPLVTAHPNDARFRVALAMACTLHYESTRADELPDGEALREARHHAERACQLHPDYGDAWATLGMVRERLGQRLDALAALERAVTLEPDNWRHWIRLAYTSWGEARLRAARRALELSPESPLALWLMATVYVARGALDLAERTIDRAIASVAGDDDERRRFAPVAVYWLKGLLLLARGADAEAIAAFERELAFEVRGHLYAREVAANSCYALGAVKLANGNEAGARQWFEQALARVPLHPMARTGLALIDLVRRDNEGGFGAFSVGVPEESPGVDEPPSEAVLALAVFLTRQGAAGIERAAEVVADALARLSASSACWLLPIEPLIGVQRNPDRWARPLARLRERAG